MFQPPTGCFVIKFLRWSNHRISRLFFPASRRANCQITIDLCDDSRYKVSPAIQPDSTLPPNSGSSIPSLSPSSTSVVMRSGTDARGTSILKSMPPEEVQIKRSRGELSCAECRRHVPVSLSFHPPSRSLTSNRLLGVGYVATERFALSRRPCGRNCV